MNKYVVYVSNVGADYSGTDTVRAVREFDECVKLSKEGYGMWSGESVTLYCNGEVVAEYEGEFEDETE